MVRKKNSGFSLVEVVVAVAILTLLIAPILTQVTQTLNTSAAAKEKQYATENAEYVLNYMQEVSVAKLKILNGKLGTTVTTNPSGKVNTACVDDRMNFTSVNTVDQTCIYHELSLSYDTVEAYLGRSEITAATIGESLSGGYSAVYSSTIYTLENAALGRKKNPYSRTVILDNLRAVLAKNECAIETFYSADAITALKEAGYTITTEGAAVKYAANGSVSDIIVTKVSGIQNPNGSGMSYMQDLDSSKVAIISGLASNFDLQAENDLYNLKMQDLKETNYAAWQQAMTSQSGSNILKTNNYLDNVSKMTRISIVSGYDTTRSLKYYDVDCTVFYEDYLVKNGAASADPVVLSYNAYAHRFYTSQAPDIYLIYEPYIGYAEDGSEQYARKDYLLTYDGVIYEAGDKHSKLYVIKPSECRLGGEASNTSQFLSKMKSSTYVPVEIYVDCLKAGDSANEPMPIFTNINLESFKRDNEISAGSKNGVQSSGNLANYYNMIKSSDTTDVDTGVTYDYSKSEGDEDLIKRVNLPAKITYGGNADFDSIQDISSDLTTSDRVYSVTVQFHKLDKDTGDIVEGESIRLSGAKGAD